MDNPLERRAFELGWLVGLIDGEGCFTLTRKTGSKGTPAYFPTIQITNTNFALIRKADRILKDNGLTTYLYSRMPKVGKPYWRLEVTGLKRVKRFMDVMGDLFDCRQSCGILK